jgi:hypothetical protein
MDYEQALALATDDAARDYADVIAAVSDALASMDITTTFNIEQTGGFTMVPTWYLDPDHAWYISAIDEGAFYLFITADAAVRGFISAEPIAEATIEDRSRESTTTAVRGFIRVWNQREGN